MSAYGMLARHYDGLTDDVPYLDWANYIETLFKRHNASPKLILDLACGTGNMALLFAQRGYEVIGVDGSAEMLSVAMKKCEGMWNKPMFIYQAMTALNLYGTVDACISCLDSINYLVNKNDLLRTFKKVSLFLNPGGLFIFDVNTDYKFRSIDGESYVRETDDVFCVWWTEYSARSRLCTFFMELFEREDERGRYIRSSETHKERAYTRDEITAALDEAGMTLEKAYGEMLLKAPREDDMRVFYVARKK